jgi:8-oxo-dGTP pyrophosphatase MutT (NUDIX family)
MKNKTKKIQTVIIAPQSNSQYLCLLLQTNKRRGEFWQNVTGKVEKNESFEDASVREAIEETGLKENNIKEIINLNLTHEFMDQYDRNVEEKAFLLITSDTWEPKLDPSEHQSYRWKPIEKIDRSSVKYPGNYDALKKAIEMINKT